MYNEKSDIYSYGMLLYEIYARKIPFSNYRHLFHERRETIPDAVLNDPVQMENIRNSEWIVVGNQAILQEWNRHGKEDVVYRGLRPDISIEDIPDNFKQIMLNSWVLFYCVTNYSFLGIQNVGVQKKYFSS